VSVDRFGGMLREHRGRGGLVVVATHLSLPLPDAAELQLG
jgi:heme exporter protein A